MPKEAKSQKSVTKPTAPSTPAPAPTPAAAPAVTPVFHAPQGTEGVSFVRANYKVDTEGHKAGELRETYEIYDLSKEPARATLLAFMDSEAAEFIAKLSKEAWDKNPEGRDEPVNWRAVNFSWFEDDANSRMAEHLAGGGKLGDELLFKRPFVSQDGKTTVVDQKVKVAPTVLVENFDDACDFLVSHGQGVIVTYRPLVGGGERDHARIQSVEKNAKVITAGDLGVLMPQPTKKRTPKVKKTEEAAEPASTDTADAEVEEADEEEDEEVEEDEEEG